MSRQCNLLTRARPFLLYKNKKVICEQLKHLLFYFHAHFILIYGEKCINIIVNKSIMTTLLLAKCLWRIFFHVQFILLD